jgi:hypothetical protein
MALMAVLLLGLPGRAQAACCVFPAGLIVTAIETATSAILGTMTTVVQANAMQVAAAIKGAQAAEAEVQIRAAGIVADTVNRVSATARRAQIDDFAQDAMTNPCSIVASTGMSDILSDSSPVTQPGGMVGRDIGAVGNQSGGTLLGGRGAVGAFAGGSARTSIPGASRTMQAVLDTSKGSAPAAAPEVTAAAAVAAACETFSSGGGLRGATCKAAGQNVGLSSGLPDADLSAVTLFDGPQGAQPRKRYSLNMSSGMDRLAVEAYTRNLSTPTPLRQLSAGELSSDKGIQYLALRDQYEARMSLAERPVKRHIARMSSTIENIPYVDTLLKSDDRDFVNQFLTKHSPNWQREGISMDEMLQLEVRRRYMNGEWIKRFAFADPGAIAAEQLRVSALQNVLLMQIMEELRETAVTRSATDMAAVRSELNPQLVTAHRAAAR